MAERVELNHRTVFFVGASDRCFYAKALGLAIRVGVVSFGASSDLRVGAVATPVH